jgi:hypothetical protein
MTPACAGRRSKHIKTKAKTTTTEALVWKANDWNFETCHQKNSRCWSGTNVKQVPR